MRLIPLALLACGCVDYRLGKVTDELPAADSGGAIEPLCPRDPVAASTLPLVEGCDDLGFPEDPDAFALEIEWQVEDFMALMHPAVANLSDDDGDGDIDGDDIPDIVIVEWIDLNVPSPLRAFSGDGSGELFNAPDFESNFGPAIGDIDGDGLPEVVGMTVQFQVRALDHTGAVKWTSEKLPPSFWLYYGQIILTDFEGDGAVEVVAGAAVLSGEDGAVLKRVIPDDGAFSPVVADLDLDGEKELLVYDGVYRADGTLIWETPWTVSPYCTPAVAQLDGDEEAEVIFLCYDEVNVHEHDGALITSFRMAQRGTSYGQPCVGDITGDGAAELVVPNAVYLAAYQPDGTELWRAEILDATSAAGCALFDMNGDGANEVLYGDEYELSVFDGRTGVRLFSDPSRGSHTGYDYPVVADVDGDGQSEVVVVASGLYGGYQGLAVYGSPLGLPDSGPVWPTHDYDTFKLDDDGHVVEDPEPGWLAHNLFHGRPALPREPDADLVVQVDAVCAEGCDADSPVYVRFRVGNQGPVDADTVHVALTVEGAEGSEVLREAVVGPVPSGQMGATREWTIQRGDFDLGAVSLSISPVDQVECGAADNVVAVPAPECDEG
ncbi:MAG: hypothetical protein H6739_40940 [Alphaproteobacteria bacterium]|nr:hypothetical protein [Alphaproteobacteria bacterium]